MAKSSKTTVFMCDSCGNEASKWQGQCPSCGAWNTLKEVTRLASPEKHAHRQAWATQTEAMPLSEVKTQVLPRQEIGLPELDRVLGGGLVPGSVILMGGEPGIGKSTILLQAATMLTQKALTVLYASGEESATQLALRADRLELKAGNIIVIAENNLEAIEQTVRAKNPDILIVDSIQTLYTNHVDSAPGSISQVRESAAKLTNLAKRTGLTIFLVGHVTKEGSLAGPKTLEHMVDTVLYFEGEATSGFRLVRAFKNRFGAAGELGVFAMTGKGLQEVSNPSSLFLTQHESPVPGIAVTATQEGNRILLVEVQALVEDTALPNPRRVAVGFDSNRLSMLLAVLAKHAGYSCLDRNVYVNIAGGLKLSEPAVDLAVVLAIWSSLRGEPLPQNLVAFGEIGLAGELRAVTQTETRVKEATKLGFNCILASKSNGLDSIPKELHSFTRIDHVLEALRTKKTSCA